MLQLKNISKKYITGDLVQQALDNVSLNFRDNEFVSILGPSGSGKSTLLNIIGGLDRYDKGNLIISGISTKKYNDKDWDSYRNHTVGFVFQSYNLIGHQTILANVELALTISGISKSERRKKAIDALEKVGLKEQINKKPNQLSGGQMQRVAIARALVNNPEILLADEPTGALDSETSIQVMNLLKQVANDRLVIMVTHNPELAKKYSTRIVELKDGKILSDSNPCIVEKEDNYKYKNLGKASMKLLTSLSLSFNNLRTKKKRTFMVSFAGSIGIIGIALILAISNGVNKYIKDTEEQTMSEYPIQITSSSISFSFSNSNDFSENEKKEGEITELHTLDNLLSMFKNNDLASLKKYFTEKNQDINKYAKAIEYNYDIEPQIYKINNDKNWQVNPNKSFESLGISSSNMFMSGASINAFNKLPENESLYKNQYNVKYGHWPTNENECVIVTNENGGLSDFLFYSLGLRENEKLESIIEDLSNGKEINTETDEKKWNYSDFDNINFKVISLSDLYSYDENKDIYVNKSEDENFVTKMLNNEGIDLKVVGIVSPKEQSTANMLKMGIYYDSSLIKSLIAKAKNSDIVKAQKEKPTINVLTNEEFGSEQNNNLDFKSLVNIDTNNLKGAFGVDTSKIKIDTSSLSNNIDLSKYENMFESTNINQNSFDNINVEISSDNIEKIVSNLVSGYIKYASKNPETNYMELPSSIEKFIKSKEGVEIIAKNNISKDNTNDVATELSKAYIKYAEKNKLPNPDKLSESFANYIKTEEAKKIIENGIYSSINSDEIKSKIGKQLEQSRQETEKTFDKIISSITADISKNVTNIIKTSAASLPNAMTIDTDKFMDSFQMNMTQDELKSFINAMFTNGKSTYENNLKTFGYAEDDNLSSIVIYPNDFDSKKQINDIISNYNKEMEEAGENDKIIKYSDIIGTMLASVSQIVNIISYVLIAFVAISLVVSSIMIGVITYISVLERRKEIGILRAIGASKRNISQVFNAETGIIGFIAGILGVGISLLTTIPINIILHKLTNVAELNVYLEVKQSIILILISIVLTLIGGIIPAKNAANSDPVSALRTE